MFIDDQEVGVTPVSTGFTYYGARNIRLVKDGYETLSVKQNFYPPWYEFPVLELFSETLWPFEKRDEHLVNFNLQPQQIVPPEKLLERAEGQRTASFQGHAAALPASAMTPTIQLPPAETIITPNQPANPTTNGVR